MHRSVRPGDDEDPRTRVVNGRTYEEVGPYCLICRHHMGDLYDPNTRHDDPKNPTFISTEEGKEYGDWKCGKCGQEYSYNEATTIELTDKQLRILKKAASK